MNDNKLIAEFMGYETYKGVDKVCINLTENNGFSGDWGHVPTKYHTSWDWLMPVVEKIEQVCEGVPQQLIHLSLFSTREEVYQAVVEFIKYQNK